MLMRIITTLVALATFTALIALGGATIASAHTGRMPVTARVIVATTAGSVLPTSIFRSDTSQSSGR